MFVVVDADEEYFYGVEPKMNRKSRTLSRFEFLG
jgi:hypothetical protein